MHHVDPRKTIKAPYSQGDVVVFGQNARQQCAVMSLCASIYRSMKGISNPNELKQIMHIGSKLYSSLSQLSIIFTASRFTINAYSSRGRLPTRIK